MKTTTTLILLFCTTIISVVRAGTIGFDPTSGLSGLAGGLTEGYEFEVTNADGIVVDGLGFWDDQSNGFFFGQSFSVGLWASGTGTLLRSVVVTSTAPLKSSLHPDGDWRVAAVAPVLLAPGLYRLGALLPDIGANATIGDPATFQSAPGINLVRFLRHIDGTTLTMPDMPPPYPEAMFLAPAFTFTSGPLVVPSNVVAPGNYVAVAGNGGLNTLVRGVNAPRTYQMQLTPAALGGLPVGARLTELRFRLSTNSTANFPATGVNWGNYEVTVAQAANSIAGMSTTFAANMIAPVLVKHGPLSLPAGTFTAGNNPNLFAPLIVFDTPYAYPGGDLVMLFSHTGSDSSATTFLDSITTTAPGYGSEFRSVSANTFGAASGSPASLVIVQIAFTPSIAISSAGSNVILTGSGLVAGPYEILTAANPALPITQWTVLTTNQAVAGGGFSYTNAIQPNQPAKYFRVRVP